MSFIKYRKHRHSPWLQGVPSPHRLSTAALLTTFSFILPAAQAQAEPVDAPITELEHVRVHADRLKEYSANKQASAKFTRALVDTPQTVAIFDRALFEEQKAATLTQALQNTPGVSTFFAGENATSNTGDTIYMRGFDSSSSIFVDGVRDIGAVTRDLFNTQRVEITKGPSGPDYGRTAPAGMINLVTKEPLLASKREVSLSYGSAVQRRLTADWNQVLGQRTALRLNLMEQNSGVPGRDVIKNRRWGIAPTVGFGLNEATSVEMGLSHIEQHNIPDGLVPTFGLPGSTNPNPSFRQLEGARPVRSNHFYATTSDFDHNSEDSMTIRVISKMTDETTLVNTTHWGSNTLAYMLTSFTMRPQNFPISIAAISNDPTTWAFGRNYPTFKNQTNRIWTNQTNLNFLVQTSPLTHHMAIGLELISERQDALGTSATGRWPNANLYSPNAHLALEDYLQLQQRGYQNARTRTVGTYLFDNIDLSQHWQLDTGLRLDRYWTESSAQYCDAGRGRINCYINDNSPLTPLSAINHQSLADSLFSWKSALVFKPSANTSLYASYALSQQPPGGASMELSSKLTSADNPTYQPQVGSSSELGFKSQWLDDLLSMNAALYSTKISHQVNQDPATSETWENGRSKVKGIELNVIGHVTDRWAVTAGWTSTHTHVMQGLQLAADGSSQLTYTPSWAWTAWTTYASPHGFIMGLGSRSVGPMKRATDSSIGPPKTVDSYWVIDGLISYALRPQLDISLNGYNLFNRRYIAAINKSGYRYTPGTPRSFLLSLTLHL